MSGVSPAQYHVTDLRQADTTTHSQFTNYYNGRPLTPPQPRSGFSVEKTLAQHINDLGVGYRNGFYGKFDWWPYPQPSGYHAHDQFYFQNLTPADPAGIFSITSDALDFIETEVAAERPFFATLSHEAVKNGHGLPETIAKYEALPPGERHNDPEYAAVHEDLDTSVGMVLDQIDELGIADNTYIILTADHGAPIGVEGREGANLPLFSGKGRLWEGGIRVPFMVSGPGIPGDTYSSVPVTSVDVVSTIYDIAGGEGPHDPRAEGVSLLPLLENGGVVPGGQSTLSRNHAPNGELFFHYPHYGASVKPASVIRDGDYKLVRYYGENGQPDQFFLFDLAASPLESDNPNSPLNLADDLPAVTAQLAAKLSNWLQDVDASLPYDIRAPLSLDWTAENTRGDTEGWKAGWRSVQDVDYLEREVWYWREGDPVTTESNAFQPGLGDKAIQFDTSFHAKRRYLHVGDSKVASIDSDHSATLEFWVKFDQLTGEQVLFEAGDASQGISITLGDADSDGEENDLRLRLKSKAGDQIAITAPIDAFANPTDDFIHIAAVVNDSVGVHSVELFLNGASRGKAFGSGVLDWDNFNEASLAPSLSSVSSIGASGGSGDTAFVGGRFRGAVARLSFANTASSIDAVQARYASMLTPTDYQVAATTGAAAAPADRPVSVAAGAFELDATLQVIHERVDSLDASLTIDAVATAGGTITGDGAAPLTGATLPSGAAYSSYLLHYDGAANLPGVEQLVGSITFANPIIGLLVDEATLDAVELLMGVAGVFDTGDRSLDAAGEGLFTLSDDLKTLSFDLMVDATLLTQLRVLTLADPVLDGDYNGDGVVDTADYLAWRDAFGSTTASLADGNRDGVVDLADYTLWRDNLGATLAEAQSVTVPEPAAALFLLAPLAGLMRRRRP